MRKIVGIIIPEQMTDDKVSERIFDDTSQEQKKKAVIRLL